MVNTGTSTIYIFSYMQDFKLFFRLLFVFFLFTAGCTPNKGSHLTAPGFSIFSADNPASQKCGKYLYDHLQKRIKDKDIILLQQEKDGFMFIDIIVDPDLEFDYTIDCKPDKLTLQAKSEEVMHWLSFQLMAVLPQYDERVNGDDLPPAVLDFHNRSRNFDFDYRDPHFQGNLESLEHSNAIATHSVDNDWGIWGHNLGKAIEKDADNSIYAWQKGRTIGDQYCFSRDGMYNQLTTYIIDNFGDSQDYIQRFMIMPNDNEYVCMCDKCVSLGNTEKNATPALSHLIKRIASRFPYHQFFTSAYITTIAPPESRWPDNTGVMISTIDIPRGVALNQQKEVKRFLNTLNKWKNCTSNLYIWDYAANFDDYLTPIPILYGLKRQLQFYKSKGVKGVFLNANGYDYSTFDDMKTYVAANIMIDTELSVDSLCQAYFRKYYPSSGEALSNYYLSLERKMSSIKKPYNMYGGFREAMDTYLDADEFVKFYDMLGSMITEAGEEEGKKLEKLYTALSFTRLQVAYYQRCDESGFAGKGVDCLVVNPQIEIIIKRLSQYVKYKDMHSYKEAGGNLDLYLANWDKLLKAIPKGNMLMGESLEVLSKLDMDYSRIDVLNDGIIGFEGEYHQGWLLNSADNLYVRFPAHNLQNAKKISLRFLLDKKHHIYPPEKVIIYKEDKIYKEIIVAGDIDREKLQVEEIVADINISGAETVSVKVFKKKDMGGTFACDEIRIN